MKNRNRFLAGIFCLLMVVFCVIGFTSCDSECEHNWSEWSNTSNTSCTEPTEQQRTCSLCDAVEKKTVDAVGHNWKSATCTTPKTCETCKATEGAALGHSWKDADCTTPKTCETCKATEGEALGHDYTYVSNNNGTHTKTCANNATETVTENCSGGTATCIDKAVCEFCKTAYGDEPTHDWGTGTLVGDSSCLLGGETEYTCSVCYETKRETIQASGHDYASTVTEPTCTEKGYTTHTCSKCSDTYTDTYVDAPGHSWDGVTTCAKGRECTVCETKEDALPHNYVLQSSTKATCEQPAIDTYKCSGCGDKYTDEKESATGHNIKDVKPTERLKEGSTCEYILYYTCKTCQNDVEGDHVHHHDYVASITKGKEPTCKTDGEKTLKCSKCSDTKTEVIKKNATGHNYVAGTPVDGKRTDECSHCGDKKTVTVYEGPDTGSVNANNFKDTEIELNNTNISFDNSVIDKIGNKDVTLSANKLGKEDIAGKLPPEKLEQVGDTPIYNFTINDGTENISKFGDDNWVTITIPYKLAEGEDVDSIAIWFIGVNGELESIKATYNNGYVTFKTNHFSYYTVTRLTPKERCEVYGHNWTTTTVDATCTSDGYELKLCVRCHATEKKITAVAQGHNYVAETTAATCTQNGKTVYKCSGCDHSYAIRIAATGHNWKLTEQSAASCTAAGYDKYSCEKCGGEYFDTFPQLSHQMTDNVVAPTCENYGYTEHNCETCDYSYQDTIVPAKGHTYEESWSWAADFGDATVTLTCKNDSTHTLSKKAEITVERTEPTCTEKGKVEYKAVAIINGVTYRDAESTEIEKLEHTYSESKHDAIKHWKECECGAKSEETAHEFDEGTETKKPTCVDAGEKLQSCACGYSKKVSVAATGEHTYENGKCTVCGKEANVCDHKVLSYKIINFADFGCCEGAAVIRTCECGEVVEVDDIDSFFELSCNTRDYDEKEEEDEENGIYTETITGTCPDCGMEVYVKYTGTENGCVEEYSAQYIFRKDGKDIINFTVKEDEEYHDDELETIDLSELGCCGGTVKVYKCEDCGKQLGCLSFSFCDGYTEKVEEKTDENGIKHTVTVGECAACGLKGYLDVWTEEFGCETITHRECKITKGDTVIVDVHQTEEDGYHDYEYEYTLLGEGCMDGYTVIATCENCGDTQEFMDVGHRDYTYGQIDISDIVPCGGYIQGSECDICGLITRVEFLNPNCKLDDGETKEETDADGVVHTHMTSTCPDCETVYKMEMWTVKENACEETRNNSIAIINKNGDVLVDYTLRSWSSNHEYETVYEMKGETCEDGYTVKEYCPKCDYSYSWTGSGHRSFSEQINLSEHGACGGYIYTSVCDICDETTSFHTNYHCNLYSNTKTEEIVGEDGLTHLVTTATCPQCSVIYITETWQTVEVDCVSEAYTKLTIKNGEETIVDLYEKETRENHEYEYTYDLKGETCEDGYYANGVCAKCGDEDSYSSSGHYRQYRYINLSEYGLCGGEIEEEYCTICKTVLHSWENSHCKWEYIESEEDGTEIYRCRNCGAEKHESYTESEKDKNCTVTCSRIKNFFINSECVYRYEVTEKNKRHNYEYSFRVNGDSCEDGVSADGVCSDCGDRTGIGFSGHHLFEKDKIELSEHSCCGGYITILECPCGEKKEIRLDETSCNFEYLDASMHGETRKCTECGLTVTYEQRDEKEGCFTYVYVTFKATLGDDTIFEEIDYVADKWESHLYEESYEMKGETCKEGVIVTFTCKDCGDSYTEERYWCEERPVVEITFSEHGACGDGYFNFHECPCGEETWVDFYCGCAGENTWEEVVGDDGVPHYVETYTCRNCGLKIVRDVYQEKEGCYIYNYVTLTVSIGDEVILDGYKYYDGRSTSHNYGYSFDLKGESCEDGYTVTYTCSDCGTSYSSEYNWHNTFVKERIELKDHGYCGGYIEIRECPCGYQKTIYDSTDCDLSSDSVYETDENGIGHWIYTYSCETCGFKFVEDDYTVREGCYDVSYRTYTAYAGDEVLVDAYSYVYSRWARHDYSYSFEINGESCEDGFTATGICRVCGYETIETNEYHRTFTLETIDLSEHGCCGGKVTISGCPCGYYSNLEWYADCNTEQTNTSYEDGNGVVHLVYNYKCDECGLVIERDRYTVKEGCYDVTYMVYNITIGKETIVDNCKTVYTRNDNHNYEYSFTMNGATCEDGYTVTSTCRDCGYSYDDYRIWHDSYLMETYELKEHGACGGTIEIYECACGHWRSVKVLTKGCSIKTEENTVDGADGVRHTLVTQTCSECGLVISTDTYSVKEGCYIVRYRVYDIIVGENVVIDGYSYVDSRYEEHSYETTFTMNGESCEDGVIATNTCKDCGESYTDEFSSHWTFEKEVYDLTKYGACDGSFTVLQCPCGKITETYINSCESDWTSNYYDDEEGRKHYVSVSTCSVCGLRYQEDSYTVRNAENCTSTTYVSIAISVGDKAVVSFDYSYINTDVHDYEHTAKLASGATNCNEGVIVTSVCRDCGKTYENKHTYHYTLLVNKIDLSQYGATCGGYANEYSCACGAEHSVNIQQSANCEFDSKYLSNIQIENSVGSRYGYIYTCAVTDPACGFKIKYMSYYLMEEGSCIAYRYETWLFGYNEQTGEYKHELTYKRSETTTNHTYETTETSDSYDGGTVKVFREECSVCGTYTEERRYYNADGKLVKTHRITENPLKIASYSYYETIYEYVHYTDANGYASSYTSREYTKYTTPKGVTTWSEHTYEKDFSYEAPFGENALKVTETYSSNQGYNDYYKEYAETTYKGYAFCIYEYRVSEPNTDSEYWYRFEYTYDFKAGCSRTVKYTDSDGENKTTIESCHKGYNYKDEGQTCTQNGTRVYTCSICKQITDTSTISPHGHYWYYDSSSKDYKCSYCGLHNANGADGSIVMEDMTEQYGDDVNYVVGYWNRKSVKYTYYVSLVLKDTEADDVFLENIVCTEMTDVRAYSFSKADVAAAAEALGYTADQYDVKFTFVPEGADGSYDYAIVFTSETAAE